MTTSPSIDLRFGGYIASVPTVAVLRSTVDPVSYDRGSTVLGNQDISDGRGGLYAWMPESLASEDNYSVVAPLVLNGGPGRWLLSIGPTPELASLVLAHEQEQAARVSGDASLSASITTETSARIEGDEAIAERTTTLESNYSSQQNALSGLSNTLTTTNARITTEEQTRASALQALASRTTSLEADYTSQSQTVDGLVSDLTTTKASLTDEQLARANADQALSQRITNLSASLDNSSASSAASVSQEATARAAADDALAQNISTLSASLTTAQNTLNAGISAESTARTNADGSLAQQITNLTATTTAADNNLSARINDEATARSTADSAFASRISTVEATTNGMAASVSETSSAISNLNGKTQAYWQVQSVAGNNRAQLTVHADANGGAGVDIVGDVSISGNLLVSGSVTTDALYANAVSNGDTISIGSSFTGSGGVSVNATSYSAGSWQTLATYSLTLPKAARVSVYGVWKQSYSTTDGQFPCAARVNINNAVVDDYWGAEIQDKVPMFGTVDLAAGTYPITVQWQGDSRVTVYRPRIKIEWFYK